ncbi:MAG: FtsW/RodA/SpoVE family cell cycle protein [Eubacteriales bacterium]
MRAFGTAMSERIKRMDPTLFICTTVLSMMSLLTIFGGMDNFGKTKFVMQFAMTVIGFVLVFLLANLDYRYIVDKLYIAMFLASVLFLAVTLVFGISGENMETSNRSWLTVIRIGSFRISVQPSEFVKLTFICTFAKHLDMVKGRVNKPLVLLGLLAHAGVIIGLILISGDLGVALVYIGIVFVMLFCAGLSLWYFLGIIAIVALLFPILWEHMAVYQQQRILVGFNPESDPFGYGMQPLMSREAIANGGLLGKGLFGGSVYEELAASHTDFIFATVCEKFGLLGGALVIITICVIVIRIMVIGARCKDFMGRLICFGVCAIFILQTLESVGMSLALIPVVGITLPFMSAGGSSTLALYMIIGVVHSVCAHEKKFYFSRDL